MKPTAILFDLDGVLINSKRRAQKHLNLAAKYRGDTETWERSVWRFTVVEHDDDEIIPTGVHLLKAMMDYYKPDKLFIVTSRHIAEREESIKTLQKAAIDIEWKPEMFFMNHKVRVCPHTFNIVTKPGEEFSHTVHKEAILRQIMDQYDVKLFVDDHGGIVKMAQSLGIDTIQPHFADMGDLLQNFGDEIAPQILPTPVEEPK